MLTLLIMTSSKMTLTFEAIFNAKAGIIYYKHLIVPVDIVAQIKEKGIKRMKITLNGSVTTHSALISDGTGNHFIIMNKENEKKLKLNLGDKVNVIVEEDTSKYGMPLSDEMAELLRIDDEALGYFDSLKPGVRRNLIYLVSKVKSSDIRLVKSLIIMDYLKMKKGNLDFKELNQCMKDWRGRYSN